MGIEIHRTGDENWPRYFLTNQTSQGDQFWNGNAWKADYAEASLYAFLPEVCREFERLQLEKNREKISEEFEATIRVKLHSNHFITEQELGQFLNRFANLFLPTTGPTENSLVQAEIHWHELRKRPGPESLRSSGEPSSEDGRKADS